MFRETKKVKSKFGCELSGLAPVDVPAMLPLRAPTIVPPRAPTMVPLRLARAPTIVPPRAVEEMLNVRSAIQRVDFRCFILFSLCLSSEWRKYLLTFRHAESFEVPCTFSTLVPKRWQALLGSKLLEINNLMPGLEHGSFNYEAAKTDYQLHNHSYKFKRDT